MNDNQSWHYTDPPHDVRQLLEDAAKLQAKLDAANREIGRLEARIETPDREAKDCGNCDMKGMSLITQCTCRECQQSGDWIHWVPKREGEA